MSERVGPFELGPPQPQWGAGFFCGRTASVDDDDLPPRVLLRTSAPGEGLAVALEGAWRARHAHPSTPALLRRGDAAGRSWLAFAPVVAVPIDLLLDEPVPVEVALSWTRELASVMAHHARHPPPSPDPNAPAERAPEPLRPSFAELLVAREGGLVVVTTPLAGRVARFGLLRQPARDRELLAPELLTGEPLASIRDVERIDVFIAGALLRAMLGLLNADVESVPARVEALVKRATAPADERFESLAELEGELVRCLEDHPHLEDAERAAFVERRGALEIERADRLLR